MPRKLEPRWQRHVAWAVAAVYANLGGQAAQAAEPAPAANTTAILVHIKATVSDPRTGETRAASTQYRVRSGERPDGLPDDQHLAFACRPYLPGDPAAGNRWRGISDVSHRIYIECELWDEGTRAFTPSMVALDGRPVVVRHVGKFPGDAASRQYEIEVTATTLPAAIDAAGGKL